MTIPAVSTVTPRFPQTVIEMPNFATDSAVAVDGGTGSGFRHSIAHAAYEEAGIGPEDVDVAEVYDLSSALELDWYEDIGLCKEGEAERLLRDGDTAVGGRIPVNPSGGLSCFGEAIPAQAIAQVCELVWQLRGQADRAPGGGGPGGGHRQPGSLRPRFSRHRHHSSRRRLPAVADVVLLEVADRVAIVTLNRPEARNAMSTRAHRPPSGAWWARPTPATTSTSSS